MSVSTTGEVVKVLKRTERLSEDLSVSRIIGPRGGQIQIARSGFRIDFAPGAVTEPTRITVTALEGHKIAYRFEPHGIEFQAPVVIRQSLRHTDAWRNPALAPLLQGSYFEKLMIDPTESFVRSFEQRPGRVRETGRTLEFSIEHFSGYIVSCGKAQVEIDVELSLR